jgi:2-polyprenyl-3-methyl-5-hydroxy-6-metoxy-1,4-benzoquinol methylase
MANPSLERIYPDNEKDEKIAGNNTLQLHLERYHYAGKRLSPGVIADIACGVGYGSNLLATIYGKKISKIIGVDNDKAAIDYAKQNYSHPCIEFQQSDAFSFQSPVLFNTIISLETIEHLSNPEQFVQHLSSQLVQGGRFIASAPVTPSMDANPYHLQDFTVSSFKKLFLSAGFKEIDSFVQVQSYNPFKLRKMKDGRGHDLRKNIGKYYLYHPGKFLLRIGSLVKDGFNNKYLVVVFEKNDLVYTK